MRERERDRERERERERERDGMDPEPLLQFQHLPGRPDQSETGAGSRDESGLLDDPFMESWGGVGTKA